MFRLRIILVMIGIGQCLPATAAVDVKSGEHADFSRVVLYYGDPVVWHLGREAEGYRLKIEGGRKYYALEGVFDFMPRKRVTDIRTRVDGLTFVLDCVCHADAFEYRPGILVVDFKDGAPGPDARFEARLVPDNPSSGGNRPPGAGKAAAGSAPVKLGAAFPFGIPDAGRPPSAEPPSGGAASRIQMRNALVESLGRAMTEGVIEPRAATPIPPGSSAGVPGLSVQTAMEQAFDPPPDRAGDGVDCPRAEAYDVAAWGDDRPAYLQLGQARAAFLDDLAQPSDAAVMRLARTYLHLGFGAEARWALTAYPVPGPDADALRAVAEVVDSPETAGPAYLRALAACDTPAALWGFLARAPDDVSGSVNGDAIIRTLSTLPLALREHVAPHVSRRFRELNDVARSNAARETVLRATDAPGAAIRLEMERARPETPDGASGDNVLVAATLEETGATSLVSLEARTEMLRRLARQGRALDPETHDEIRALIHESKGLAAAADLLQAYVDVLSASGQYADALAYLRRLHRSEFRDSLDLTSRFASVYSDMTVRASDTRFLAMAAEFPPTALPVALPEDAAGQVARRLESLGFRDAARLFAPVPDGPLSEERRLGLASEALRNGEPGEALARLTGATGAQVQALRAEALAEMGAYSEAGQILADLGRTAEAAELYWAGRNWAQAAALLPPGPRRDVALGLAEAGYGIDPRFQDNDAPAPNDPVTATGRNETQRSGATAGPQPEPSSGVSGTREVSLGPGAGSGSRSRAQAAAGDAGAPEPVSLQRGEELVEQSASFRALAAEILADSRSADAKPASDW